MREIYDDDTSPLGFLPFAMATLEVFSLLLAGIAYLEGYFDLVSVYFSIAVVVLACIGLHYVFLLSQFALWLFVTTLVVSHFLTLVYQPHQGELIALSLLPFFCGVLGYQTARYVLAIVFFTTLWLFLAPNSPLEHSPEITATVRYFLAFFVVSGFSIAMDRNRLKHMATMLNITSQFDQIAHQDHLTGLPNRHDMERRLEGQLQQFKLNGRPFSILLCDIDNFKFINDRYGHDIGDHVLHDVGKILHDSLRGDDVIARWGGDEYLILLPGISTPMSADVAERLCKAVSTLHMEALGDNLRFTLSGGVAAIDKCTGIDDLISTAENGLYQAKHMGRDMVVAG